MAIDKHVLARNSQFLNYWELVFDKNSAIIVRGIQFEDTDGYPIVYDVSFCSK